MSTIGFTTLQIIPSMKGIEGRIKGTLIAPLTDAGKTAGKNMGDAIADGIKASKGKVEKAAADVAKARDKEADAAGKVRVAEKQLEDLRSNARAKAGQIVAAEEKIAKAKRDSAAASKQAADAEGKLGSAKKDFEAIGKDNGKALGGGMMSGVGGAVGSLGSKAGPIGLALASVAGLGIAAGTMLMGAIQDGMQKEVKQDLIQAQLGVNEETAARIGKAAGSAYVGNFGTSVAENMDAARIAVQSGLLSGEESAPEIQSLIQRLTTVSDLMGEDLPMVARSAGQAIKTGMAKDGVAALDLLTASTQKGLNVNEDLLDTLNEYSTQFRKLGLSGDEAMGLVSQAVQNGARDTDVAADALKEFSIRAVDGSESTVDAYQKMGLNAAEMGAQFAQGGAAAKAGLDLILDKFREMPPSVEKNQLAFALFGTQSEDLGAALGHMDLSNASRQLGDVAGAADRAAQTIGNNPAAAMETAKRSIEQSSNEIKGSLAQAFGPAIQDMASWISAHQPEILGFFKGVGDASFILLDAMLAMAQGTLGSMSLMSNGIGDMVEIGAKNLGRFAGALGSVISVIPGMEGVGDSIKNAGDKAYEFGESAGNLGEKLGGMADAVGDARSGLSGMRGDFDTTAKSSIHAAEMARMFGGTIEAVPDSKDVHVQALTAEAQALVDQFGLKVTTLPDGTSIIHAETKAGQAEIDRWVNVNNGRQVSLKVTAQWDAAARAAYFGNQNAQGPFPANAAGGWIRGPGSGTSDSILSRVSNGEFIVNARDAKKNAPLLDAVNGGWTPPAAMLHAMLPGFAKGGLVQTSDSLTGTQQAMWDAVANQFPDAVLSSATRTQEMGAGYDFHMQGKAIDISGPSMGAINAWIASKYPNSEELFYDPGANIDEGKPTSAIGGHSDHVHWAMASAPSVPSDSMDGGSTASLTPQEQVAAKIIAEGRKRGYSDSDVKAILATALQESNLDPSAQGGGGAWHGVFQQDSSYSGRDNADTNIGGFYDRLDQKRKGAPGGDIWKDIFWLQQAPGASSAEAAVSGGRQGYLSEIQSKQSEADQLFSKLSTSGTPSSSSASTSTGDGTGTPVYVTNWPSGFAGVGSGTSSMPSTTGDPAAQFTAPSPGAESDPNTPQMDVQGKAAEAGRGFLEANANQFGSDLGYSGQGAIPKAFEEGGKWTGEYAKQGFQPSIVINAANPDQWLRELMQQQRRLAKSFGA